MYKKIFWKKIARRMRYIQYLTCSDEKFLKKKYKKLTGENADLVNPKSFSEKLLYLMVHYRNPLESLCADKYHVREYIRACGFEDIIRPHLAIYRNAYDIDFDNLPNEFFLKTNHVSGNFMIVNKDKHPNYDYIRKYFQEILRINYYYVDREIQYKNIEPVIICEPVLRDSQGNLPVDYKFYCFDGKPMYFMVSYGEYDHKVRNHKFNMNKESIDYHFKKESTLKLEDVVFPENLDRMIEIVEKLCKPFPHVRVDLYNVDGHIYFGELTFYSNSGIVNVYDKQYDIEIGSWINLDHYKDYLK